MQRYRKDLPSEIGQAAIKDEQSSEKPTVTAIIPAYNAEQFIERSLQSALNQTYANLDIIVINDGSTDGTEAIVSRSLAAHKNLRIVSTANAGVAAARNLGAGLANSLYVAYLDADDLWHPEKIAKQVSALEAHGHGEEWAACYTASRMIDADDLVMASPPASRARGDFFEEHLTWNHLGNGSNLLVRRDVALAVGGFDPSYRARGIGGCEDLEFQLKLLRAHKMELVREYLVGYRIHPEQMSCNLSRMGRARVAVVQAIIGETKVPPRTGRRALVCAQLAAAQAFLYARDWGGFARSSAASLSYSVSETAKELAKFFVREFIYGVTAFSKRIFGAGGDLPPPVPFAALDPAEGVAENDNIRGRQTQLLLTVRSRPSR